MIAVRLSKAARAFLLSETAYLRARSVPASHRLKDRFRELRRRLSIFPEMGFVREDFPRKDIRRIVLDDYVIDYRVTDTFLRILSIRHGRQSETDVPFEDDQDFES